MRVILLLLAFLGSALAQSTNTAPMGQFPALNVQVTVGTKQRPQSGSYYQKTMTVEPKLSIEGASHMLAIPAATATLLIITMDTRAKFTQGREAYSVHGSETLPIPEVKSGGRRQFDFGEYTMTFDSYRDSSNIGGKVYKYYVFGLRDPATKALIDFKTNNPSLATYCKAHPEKRDEFLSIAKGSAFPADFK